MCSLVFSEFLEFFEFSDYVLTFRIFMLSRAGDPGTPIPGRETGRPWEALGRPGAPI